jgi:hypothetical protein
VSWHNGYRRRAIAAFTLLAVAASACGSPFRLRDIAPLGPAPAPQLEFSDRRETRWVADGRNLPRAYRVGTAKVPGMTAEQALVIAALPGSEGTGGMVNADGSIEPWRGKRVRLSARLKSEEVERLQLWLHIVGTDNLQERFYDMADKPIRGTTDWQRYEIVLDVPEDTAWLQYGFFIAGGKGKAFADAVTLESVGPEIAALQLPGTGADGWQTRNPRLVDQTEEARYALLRAREAKASDRGPERNRWPEDRWLETPPWDYHSDGRYRGP